MRIQASPSVFSAFDTTHDLSSLANPAPPPSAAWLGRLALLNDFMKVGFATGSAFASQFLYREFVARGHEVSVMGGDDPALGHLDLPARNVVLPSLPLRTHPGVRLPLPSRRSLNEAEAFAPDMILGQTCTPLLNLGSYLRRMQQVPYISVNTFYLPEAYSAVIPEWGRKVKPVLRWFMDSLVPYAERKSAMTFNDSDGIVVLCQGLKSRWEKLGVTVPIHVIPRAVDPKIFGSYSNKDPFDPRAKRGSRLLVVCRHVKEKAVDRLIEIFAKHIAPYHPDVTLTMVGDGPDHAIIRKLAERLGVADRVFWPGEVRVTDVSTWYRHADLFVYTSLSETYGQVVSEAMYCGLPVVAFDDEMGVADQVAHEQSGFLIGDARHRRRSAEGPSDEAFGRAVLTLLENPELRGRYADRAERLTQLRTSPEPIVQRYYEAFESARAHCHQAFAGVTRPDLAGARKAVARWTAIQLMVAVTGLFRSKRQVNRAGTVQPNWNSFAPKDAHKVLEAGAEVAREAARTAGPADGPWAGRPVSRRVGQHPSITQA